MKKKLTQKILKEWLDYDHKTGIFTWKVETYHGAAKPGDIAGRIDDGGYIAINLCNGCYRAHRLAWLFHYGYFPENGLDHIDQDKTNTRIKNLREASKSCNARNTGNKANNTSGVKGISWDKQVDKWKTQITVNYKNSNLGVFHDFDEAVCTRLAAEQCVGWSGCDSSSPAFRYVQKMLGRS